MGKGPENGSGKVFSLSHQAAQAIVEEIGRVVKQNINLMDEQGAVIASTDLSRVGTIHEAAARMVQEGITELCISESQATATARQGVNLSIFHEGKAIGVIGITGLYGEVAGYGQVVKKMVEILIRENVREDERRMGERVEARFLEDWVLGDGLMQPQVLAERGFRLGIDISLPRRVMVVSPGHLEEYGATAQGQKALEQVERETALAAGEDCLILKNAGRQILLVRKGTDDQLEELAGHICRRVEERTGVSMAVGIDGKSSDIHMAYGQANKAWRSARMAAKEVQTYDGVTLELFTGDVAEGVKLEYIRKVFQCCGYEELCQWMGIIEAYFEAEGSLQRAADSLHMHKNTLTYKLKKLKELTGHDVRIVNQAPVLYMALLFFRDVKAELEND